MIGLKNRSGLNLSIYESNAPSVTNREIQVMRKDKNKS